MDGSRVVRFAVLIVLTLSFAAHAAAVKKDLPDGKGTYMLVLPKNHDPKSRTN